MHNEEGSERIGHAETVDPGWLASMSTFTPEQWKEVSPYLDHALSLNKEEREGWLQSFRLAHETKLVRDCPARTADGASVAHCACSIRRCLYWAWRGFDVDSVLARE